MINELFSLKGKTAVVTGAAGLLGKHHCIALKEAGANVIAADIDYESASKIFGDSEIIPKSLDVSDISSVEALRNYIIKEFNSLDILVNNAALNDKFEDPQQSLELSKFENFPLEMWNKAIQINLTGTFLCSQILGTEMVKAGKGSIINIGSTYGIVAPDQSLYRNENGEQIFYKSAVYPVTKSAVISLTKYLAAYWGGKGLRVNCISPGGVKNNQDIFFINNYSKRTPSGRMAEASDYSGALLFLASDASSYVNGENLVVDGGYTIW